MREFISTKPTLDSSHFGRNLNRYIRFRYPTAMIRTSNFEINEDGVPFWVCEVEDKTIGLFGGTDIKGRGS